MKIDSMNLDTKEVRFTDGSVLTVKLYYSTLMEYFQDRICGETLIPTDMEQFMYRTSGKNLELLIQGKKQEGFLEGSMGKTLTSAQKIAIGTIVTLAMVGLIVLVVLNQQGMIPGLTGMT